MNMSSAEKDKWRDHTRLERLISNKLASQNITRTPQFTARDSKEQLSLNLSTSVLSNKQQEKHEFRPVFRDFYLSNKVKSIDKNKDSITRLWQNKQKFKNNGLPDITEPIIEAVATSHSKS